MIPVAQSEALDPSSAQARRFRRDVRFRDDRGERRRLVRHPHLRIPASRNPRKPSQTLGNLCKPSQTFASLCKPLKRSRLLRGMLIGNGQPLVGDMCMGSALHANGRPYPHATAEDGKAIDRLTGQKHDFERQIPKTNDF